ncbi:MAG: HD domain-containing protein [Myxococcales bacterium]|nr:HD domain-containing protein [Myxococcales bacterium]
MQSSVRIRDPIHGTQRATRAEIAIIEHRAVQRLRYIKQLGMADLAYPGATHTRYAHALGVMHVAGRIFDAVNSPISLHPADRTRLRSTLRLAALFHDLGHPPLSHSTELLMPSVDQLNLGPWQTGRPHRRATHEDYTLKIVLDSDLTQLIEERMNHAGIKATDLANLLTDHPPPETASRFVLGGYNWRPFLRQCIASELDADRMDYLLRDSYFAGVPYGRYDLEWLLENLRLVERPAPSDEEARPLHLGLSARASFGFEDYLLSRYHMFLAVYLHHVPVGYELMLERLKAGGCPDFILPSSISEYLRWDDVHFFHLLRNANDPWAKRIAERKGFRLLVEHKQQDDEPDPLHTGRIPLRNILAALDENRIAYLTQAVKSRLSKYFEARTQSVDLKKTPPLPGIILQDKEMGSPTIYVVEDERAVPLETHVALYRRYRGEVSLERIYVSPEQLDPAKEVIRSLK